MLAASWMILREDLHDMASSLQRQRESAANFSRPSFPTRGASPQARRDRTRHSARSLARHLEQRKGEMDKAINISTEALANPPHELRDLNLDQLATSTTPPPAPSAPTQATQATQATDAPAALATPPSKAEVGHTAAVGHGLDAKLQVGASFSSDRTSDVALTEPASAPARTHRPQSTRTNGSPTRSTTTCEGGNSRIAGSTTTSSPSLAASRPGNRPS